MSVLNNRNERGKFIRFAIVGAIGSVIDFGVFNLLTSALKFPAIPSSVVSFSLAVINNFILNRNWTYPETRATPITKQLIQFSIVSVAGLAIRTPLFALIEKPLISLAVKWLPNVLTPTIIGHNLSLAIVILVVLLWNFFINRKWTFKPSVIKQEEHL
ncbi:MAG TPA: GtrA family protein [Anaerolineaceae bacterium]|nr:GtrA family protein [Anaerolineaceae bacterium]